MNHFVKFFLVFIFFTLNVTSQAEINDSSHSGFTVVNKVEIDESIEVVYLTMCEKISLWWDNAHTFSGKSSNLTFEARANGCFCEKLINGGSACHLTVVYIEPGKLIRLVGGLGPLQQFAVNGVMSWEFKETPNGTIVEWTYTVGGYVPQGLQSLAVEVDHVLNLQLKRFKNYVKNGKPE